MVARPIEYRWSSYDANAAGHPDDIITPHNLYQTLGKHLSERQHAYRELFLNTLGREQLHDIRATVQTGTPLGNDRFRRHIEQTLECKVGQARRGRPKKAIDKGY